MTNDETKGDITVKYIVKKNESEQIRMIKNDTADIQTSQFAWRNGVLFIGKGARHVRSDITI